MFIMSPQGSTSNQRSPVWNYFQKHKTTKHVICNICQKNIKYLGGTSSLNQHLLRIHPTLKIVGEASTEESKNPKANSSDIESNDDDTLSGVSSASSIASNLKSIARSSAGVTLSKKDNFPIAKKNLKQTKQLTLFSSANKELSESKTEVINKKLLKLITKDYQPVSIVGNEGFLEYTHELQPLYTPPSRKRLTNDILPFYYMKSATLLKSNLN